MRRRMEAFGASRPNLSPAQSGTATLTQDGTAGSLRANTELLHELSAAKNMRCRRNRAVSLGIPVFRASPGISRDGGTAVRLPHAGQGNESAPGGDPDPGRRIREGIAEAPDLAQPGESEHGTARHPAEPACQGGLPHTNRGDSPRQLRRQDRNCFADDFHDRGDLAGEGADRSGAVEAAQGCRRTRPEPRCRSER